MLRTIVSVCSLALLWSACDRMPSMANYAPSVLPQGPQSDAPILTPTDESYTNYGVNPWTDPAEDNLSTFAIDVDSGSYTLMRAKVSSGIRPPKESVRVEEYINYFNYGYSAPEHSPIAVHVDGSRSPFNGEHYFLRIGLQGQLPSEALRVPAHLVFLVDVSGSMGAADKLKLAQQSLKILVDNLQPGDTVGIVTYASGSRIVLQPTGISDKAAIIKAIDSLNASGSTAMSAGMEHAYTMAASTYQEGHVNRVIVLSDGDANIGAVSYDQMLDAIAAQVKLGVTMSTIGFGSGNYKDNTMEQLADKGNGNYFYIDSLDEAQRVFGTQLTSTLQVIAKDVKIQIAFDPACVAAYRLIGYENRNLTDDQFSDDRVDAGELGLGHNVTAIYELKLKSTALEQQRDGGQTCATAQLRFKAPESETSDLLELPFRLENLDRPFDQASWSYRWAVAVTAFAEILRESPHATSWTLTQVVAIATAALQSGNGEQQEFIGLVQAVAAMR